MIRVIRKPFSVCDIRSIDYFAGVLDAASENDSALRSAMKNASTPSIRYNYQMHFPGDNAVQNVLFIYFLN
jgi:hypothetical protein